MRRARPISAGRWKLLVGCCLSNVLMGALFAAPARAADRLPSYVKALMRGRQGAVVVSNPATGEILAEWNPELAFQRAFPPGSTAKIVTAAAALESGAISPRDRIFCRRIPELLGERYHCSHPPALAAFTLAHALANSCNYFFSALSTHLSPDSLGHEYAVLGFGEATGAGGHAGQPFIPDDPAAKARVALGEGSILVTPAQLLAVYSMVATRGVAFPLRHASGAKDSQMVRRVRLQTTTWEILAEGLEACVRSGTGQAAAVAGVRVAGKTGTAVALNTGGATHAWFVGYAPVESPQVALVIFLIRGTGARDAAPLAGRILRHYFAAKERGR